MKKPRYSDTVIMDFANGDQVLAAVVLTVHKLNWDIRALNGSTIEAFTRFSWKSVSEKVLVDVTEGEIKFSSECRDNQFTDWKKNRQNWNKFNELLTSMMSWSKSQLSEDAVKSLLNSKNVHVLKDKCDKTLVAFG